jgi:tripartite-type tricarboxylate transporter receptor subunit TctC
MIMGAWPRLRGATIAAAGLACCAANAALAEDAVEQFYRGKTISIYVGASAGGGYDTYARLLARYWRKYIPGNPTIVVQNMPGAGSNKAAGYIYSVAPKDGAAVGAIFPGAILQPLLGDVPVQHDPSKFVYLGSANSEIYICIVRPDAPAQTFKDVMSHQVIVGSTGEGGTSHDLATMVNNLLGAKFRIVTGYAGTNEITLGIERNEIQGMCGIGYTSLVALHPDWLAKGTIRILAQETVKAFSPLTKMGVPQTIDFAKTDIDRQAMELVYSQGVFGRPFLLPPSVPPGRVEALRQAFVSAFQDKGLVAEAEKMRLDIEIMPGDELQAMVAKLYAMPAAIIGTAKRSLIYTPPS